MPGLPYLKPTHLTQNERKKNMSKKTAYMSRADVIVLLSAHCASNMLDSHGGSADVPKRIVTLATQIADELVTQGVVEAPEADDDKGGPFYSTAPDGRTHVDERVSVDDELDFDDEDEQTDENTPPSVPATEPASAPPMQPGGPFAPIEQPISVAEAPAAS